ncbi:RHS repeat-associated core domain-containing protein [Stenotrophomonas acidaminiphila]|uniref:RHS repeat-associated core domain-containing protein n=1 Tax=Stenotrophomonas acidaminiphila TaxID=128780 RepID=UPI003D0B137F
MYNLPVRIWDIRGEAFGSTPPDEDPDNDGVAFAFDLRYPGQRYDNTTGLNYNYFRDYDPGTGRYVQSDPIGLMGGINTYGYVVGNPLLNSDPRGLVTWRGYAHGAGFGHAVIAAARYNFHLVSDCVNGRQAIVDIDASFFGGGLGAPITYTISQVSLGDGKSEIDPYALTGSASMKGAGLAAGGGVAYSGFQLGAGKSPGAWGGQGGWDATLYWYPIGNSKMDGSPKWVSCGACGSK